MQVTVEQLNDLERRMTVQVPAETVDAEILKRLTELSRTVRLDGFRPGKVPVKVLKRMYGPQVRHEVVGEVVQSSFKDALDTQSLSPVGSPEVDLKNLDEGADLEYSVTFEVLPELEVQGLDTLSVERPVAEVTQSDVDNMIETLRRRHVAWNDVERGARMGDRVIVDFEGKIDGEDFPGSKGEQVPLVLGDETMPSGFGDALLGLHAGEEAQFDFTLPESFGDRDVAGKTALFHVRVEAVAESEMPALDDAFATTLGVKEGGLDALGKEVRANMEHELKQAVKSRIKRQVLQHLIEFNEVPVPRAMVDSEIKQLARQAGMQIDDDEDGRALAEKAPELETEARRRVALGLIVGQMISSNNIKLDRARVNAYLQEVAGTFEDRDAVVKMYQSSPRLMASIESSVLEEQLIDWLLERAQVTERVCSFDEVTEKAGQQPITVSEGEST